MTYRFRHLTSVALALALLPAAAVVAAAPENSAMHDSTTTVSSPLATLEVTARYDRQQQKLAFTWTLRNSGTGALAVFDRGDTMAWHRRPLGKDEVAQVLRKQEGGVLVLSHKAMPLPHPSPTVPPVPLAQRVDAGASHQARFEVDLLTAPPKVRYCLGVAPFDAGDYSPAGKAGEGTWRASFKVVTGQTLLCTPPFDLDDGRFEAPQADAT